jgi:hypothetical protein
VHAADPEVVETIKRRNLPHFTLDGNICALASAKDHLNVVIFDSIAPDPDRIINQGAGQRHRPRHPDHAGRGNQRRDQSFTARQPAWDPPRSRSGGRVSTSLSRGSTVAGRVLRSSPRAGQPGAHRRSSSTWPTSPAAYVATALTAGALVRTVGR